jgi:hypothetical protein
LFITASRARSSDIGKERENSRIGRRRIPALPGGFEPAVLGGFFCGNGLRCNNDCSV